MSGTGVRPPAVSGMFYPSDAAELKRDVDTYIGDAAINWNDAPPKAVIAPHAGYVYSGPIAGYAYAALAALRNVVTRVILIGPAHRIAFPGIAYPSCSSFSTPLGEVPVDRAACDALNQFPYTVELDEAHREEHGLEVHLPFLQETLEEFAIVPLVVGDATPAQAAELIEHLWGGPETLIVVSSDLSHYLPYDEAARIDRVTSDAIEKLDGDAIGMNQACGRLPICGLLTAAAQHHLTARTLDLRNSGDTAGDKSRVVGYGAYAFHA